MGILPPDAFAFTRLNMPKLPITRATASASKANTRKLPPLNNRLNSNNATQKASFFDTSDEEANDSTDDFEPAFFDDTNDDRSDCPAVASQPGGISDLTDPEWILNDWKRYEEKALRLPRFTKKHLEAIRLVALLRHSKASMDTYDKVMQWHFRENGDIHMHESASSRCFMPRAVLFDYLKKRYNRHEGYGIVNEIVLPSKKSRVRMVTNDAAKVIQSLLTRPENKAKDYLFYGEDPFKRPPKDLDYISDSNTGRCYSDTYDALIKDPEKEVLLELQMAADGTHLGQFSSFELTRFQVALGMLTREAREKDYNWGTLGWIPNIPKDKSHGRRSFVDSLHADSTRFRAQLDHDEGLIGVNGNIHPSQDLHAMISYVLKGIVQLQKTGFIWDLYYNGRLHKGVKFIPFVSFLRVDTKEADLFCGKYTNRNAGVKQLCRECYCPTLESDNHLASHRPKLQHRIAALVARKDEEALKNMSQQYILNAFYDLQFGCHNEMGIHGACPMEMLHAILLGVFKYARDIFFEQVGDDSKSAREIDAIAMLYGELYGRQSDRQWPNTRFPGGIRAGKVNGKKYTGILLCLLSAITSGKGRKILESRPKWRQHGIIDDWIMLLETLLEWEAWLNSPKMLKSDVQRAKTKHRYIIYLMRKVALRKTGMGLKLMKIHGILHMADAILNFGVPLEYDTGCNESHHIGTKKASQLTQKDLTKVEEQTAERMLEMEVLTLAQAEIDGTWLCDYRLGHASDLEDTNMAHKTRTFLGGAAYYTYQNGQTGEYLMRTERPEKGKKEFPMVENDLAEFIYGLQVMVKPYIDKVFLYSCYTRNGHIFRGDLSYRKNVWRDWVVINWGRDGKLPNRIYGFLDLTALPDNITGQRRIKYGGLGNVSSGIYAIVEATVEGCDGVAGTELFDVLATEVGQLEDGIVSKLKFYLADVETFEGPCVVVPNVGGPNNSYFWIEPRARWSKLFVDWLRAPHKDDHQEDLTAMDRLAAEVELEAESAL